jgi:F-type H+-transporting ATPase subunit b
MRRVLAAGCLLLVAQAFPGTPARAEGKNVEQKEGHKVVYKEGNRVFDLDRADDREATIHDALADAKKEREEAEVLRAQLQEQVNRAHEEVRAILDAGRRAAQRQHDEMMEQARQEIQAERERLHREMELARDQALRQIWSQGARLAALVSAKVIRRQLTPDDHRQLVEEALAELRGAGAAHQRMVASVQ